MNQLPASPEAPKGFFAKLLERIDRALKSAADKKGSCCCNGSCESKDEPPKDKCC